ncbi:MAG TPA: hypothetical protein DEB10_04160 [Ruminococcaceae bacterium]|jgi:teichoic acid transport system permease protein|nr:hypothetical protein [Oscillospiraceae bacterium]HCA28346.1 hypothetical protein [Oscillospiraceae bacterium]
MIYVIKEIVRDHIQNKAQIIRLAKADLFKTYRGAALGWAWAVIKPCVTIAAYWFAFSVGLRKGSEVAGYPFILWLIAGIIPWFYMSEMLTQGTDSLRRYSYLVTKMKFPISTIPTFVSLSKMFINSIMILIVIIIFWISGFPPTIYYLQIPFYLLLDLIFFTLWAQFSSLLAAVSKDFANLVKSFVTAIFWFSGVLWDAKSIKISWLRKLLYLNPITFLINGFRDSFINKVWFFDQLNLLKYFSIITLFMFVLVIVSYKKLRRDIPDVL